MKYIVQVEIGGDSGEITKWNSNRTARQNCRKG